MTKPFAWTALAGLLTLSPSPLLPAQPAEAIGERPAEHLTEHLAGTVLQLEPRVSYERAFLRVAGPQGYELRKRLAPGEPIAADLLAEAETRRPEETGADGKIGREERGEARASWTALPEGRYVYEVVFTGAAGESLAHVGHFRVENGAAIPIVTPRSEPEAEDEGSSPEARLAEKSFVEADFIKIDDSADDGTTFLMLDSDNSFGATYEVWGLFNRFGDFSIEECGNGSNLGACETVALAILDDPFGRNRVGIGTAAPGMTDLHIVSLESAIRLEDTDHSTWEILELAGSLDFRLLDPSPETPDDPTGSKLHLDGSGDVGIGTMIPEARLHVMGGAVIEGDVAMGSSRTIKHGIEPVEPAAVLAAVRELPIYSWRYRADPAQALHLGPMAEDFHTAFRTGRDEEHLSPGDSAGVALAAVQGVDAEVRRLSEENRELKRRLEALEELLLAGTCD